MKSRQEWKAIDRKEREGRRGKEGGEVSSQAERVKERDQKRGRVKER